VSWGCEAAAVSPGGLCAGNSPATCLPKRWHPVGLGLAEAMVEVVLDALRPRLCSGKLQLAHQRYHQCLARKE